MGGRNKRTTQHLSIKQTLVAMLSLSLVLYSFSPYLNAKAEEEQQNIITEQKPLEETPVINDQPNNDQEQPVQESAPVQEDVPQEDVPQTSLPEDATPNPTVPCGQNMIVNGDFEQPVVSTAEQWDIFDSGTSGIGWQAAWHPLVPATFNSSARPPVAKIELQRGVNGWIAQSGEQYAEMDTDWDGPAGALAGEPSSIRLFQYLSTTPGKQYDVVFYTSPRPGLDGTENNIEVDWDSAPRQGAAVIEDGSLNTNTVWTKHSYVFTASSAVTRLTFIDRSIQDSLGMFLDNVSVIERCPYKIIGQKFGDQNSNGQKETGEKGLKGWKIVAVDPNPVANIEVPAKQQAGKNTVSLPAGLYFVTASGSWTNNNDPSEMFDAEYHTADSWTTNTDGTIGYPEAGPDQGDLQINDTFINWGAYNSGHVYQTFYDSPGGAINFAVFEGDATTAAKIPAWYADNHKALIVKVYKVIASSITGPLGNYELMIPETYTGSDIWIYEILKSGWVQTFPANPGYHTVTLDQDHKITGKDFGNHNTVQVIEVPISGHKFNDLDGNGQWDSGESGLSGWTIYYDANNNSVLDSGEKSAVTDSSGGYVLTGFGAGTFVIREVAQPGWTQTFPAAGFQSVVITTTAPAGVDFGNKQQSNDQGGCADQCETTDGGGSGSGTQNTQSNNGGSGGPGASGELPGSSTSLLPQPQVLGINTGDPGTADNTGAAPSAPQPEVLGATTLPRTGVPVKVYSGIQLLLVLAAAIYFRQFAAKRLGIS